MPRDGRNGNRICEHLTMPPKSTKLQLKRLGHTAPRNQRSRIRSDRSLFQRQVAR